jgi:hypothetical protein
LAWKPFHPTGGQLEGLRLKYRQDRSVVRLSPARLSLTMNATARVERMIVIAPFQLLLKLSYWFWVIKMVCGEIASLKLLESRET